MDRYFVSIIVPHEDGDDAFAAVSELAILEDLQKRRVFDEKFGLDASTCEIAGILVGSAALLGQVRKLIVEMDKIKLSVKDESREFVIEGRWSLVQACLARIKQLRSNTDDEVK